MAKNRIPSMGGMNMNAMLRQAQKMQSDMENARRELDEKEYEFTSGGGEVCAVVNGKFECVKLTISPDVIDPEDADMLADLILLTVNGAVRAAREDAEKTMSRVSGGMNMGGLL